MKLYEKDELMDTLLQIRLEEEKARLDGVGNTKPKDFVFHTQLRNNTKVIDAYEIMQIQYVFRESERIPFKTVTSNMDYIFNMLEKNSAWIFT